MTEAPVASQAAFCGLIWRALGILVFAILSACEESPVDRCVKSRLKVFLDAEQERRDREAEEARKAAEAALQTALAERDEALKAADMIAHALATTGFAAVLVLSITSIIITLKGN
jgi:hypothetical protein